MGLQWDPRKAESNFRKHGVRFAETEAVFEDDFAITIQDDESSADEMRFITIGMGTIGRVLVVIYAYRGDHIRIVSARLAEPRERTTYEEAR